MALWRQSGLHHMALWRQQLFPAPHLPSSEQKVRDTFALTASASFTLLFDILTSYIRLHSSIVNPLPDNFNSFIYSKAPDSNLLWKLEQFSSSGTWEFRITQWTAQKSHNNLSSFSSHIIISYTYLTWKNLQ